MAGEGHGMRRRNAGLSERSKVVLYNGLAILTLALVASLPLLPSVQAAFTWMGYYLTTPYAKLPSAIVQLRVRVRGPDGSYSAVRDVAVIWLASPTNNHTSRVVHRGLGDSAVIALPRVHLNRVASVDGLGRVSWVDLYNVENLLIVASTVDNSCGAVVIGIEVKDPVIGLTVEVEPASKLAGPSAPAPSSTWYHLVEVQERDGLSAFTVLHPDLGVSVELTVPQGVSFWFESKSRAAPSYSSLPSASWSSGMSGVSLPGTLTFHSTVRAPDGGYWIRLGMWIRWRYERWERYDNGVLTQIIECIFPHRALGGAYYLEEGSYTPPAMSGNVKPIGDGGACVTWSISGTWQFDGLSVSLSFGVSYPTGGVTIGVSLSFVIRYAASSVRVCVIRNAYDPFRYSVYAFDQGTNWGRIFTAWIPDT
ncbi:MAG: hypothetical protein QXY35_07215 [Thermofilaceae archaeon]